MPIYIVPKELYKMPGASWQADEIEFDLSGAVDTSSSGEASMTLHVKSTSEEEQPGSQDAPDEGSGLTDLKMTIRAPGSNPDKCPEMKPIAWQNSLDKEVDDLRWRFHERVPAGTDVPCCAAFEPANGPTFTVKFTVEANELTQPLHLTISVPVIES